MASSITRHLQRASPPMKLATTRRYYHSSKSPFQPIDPNPQIIFDVSPSVVALLSYFSGPKSREIPYSASRGTAVFVDRTLLVTSARSVGRISTVYDSERSSVLHNCFIARTIAFPSKGKPMRTSPLAVNFAGDVAVLKVEEADLDLPLPPPLPVADVFAERNSALIGVSRHENTTTIIVLMKPKMETGIRPKAPWPLEEKLGWVDYDVGHFNIRVGATATEEGTVDQGSGSEDVRGGYSLPEISGSPWFNMQREVVGIASWAAEDGDGVSKSYAVPPSRIRSVMDYAKTKGPQDPIVMDRWINARTIPDHKLDICELKCPELYAFLAAGLENLGHLSGPEDPVVMDNWIDSEVIVGGDTRVNYEVIGRDQEGVRSMTPRNVMVDLFNLVGFGNSNSLWEEIQRPSLMEKKNASSLSVENFQQQHAKRLCKDPDLYVGM